MVTLDEVARMATALPEVTEGERHGLACAPVALAQAHLERSPRRR